MGGAEGKDFCPSPSLLPSPFTLTLLLQAALPHQGSHRHQSRSPKAALEFVLVPPSLKASQVRLARCPCLSTHGAGSNSFSGAGRLSQLLPLPISVLPHTALR